MFKIQFIIELTQVGNCLIKQFCCERFKVTSGKKMEKMYVNFHGMFKLFPVIKVQT